MSPFLIRNSKSQTSGTALVIVLTFLIILSGMVIAFMEFSKWDLQTAQASARNLQAQEIALGGADAVASLLLTEIDDAANSERNTVDNITLYQPKADAHLFPERVVASAASAFLPSLIKSSRHGVASYAAAAAGPASQAPTSTVSANSRALDFDFWNTPRLNFSTPDAQSAYESTAAPDWILITKDNGAKAFTAWSNDLKDPAKPDFVIGRYAYTVYDVSGLLDISVAGRPPVSQTAYGYQDQAVLDAKSRPALIFADLTQIPGIANAASASAFIAWRNAASAATASDFHDYIFSEDEVPNDWTLRDFSKTKYGDNAFFSRGDLIKAVESGACGITADALPYLTTFSRMKNAPSWSPTADEASPYRYKTDANKPASINRNLGWVRVKNEFIRQDGTTAKVGEPLIQRRFPLSGFGLITTGATTADTAADIQAYFGLIRSTTGGPWTYSHGNNTRILTLDEVADTNREPDLQELLQATILNGSLASGDPARPASTIANEKTLQILSILANMIDQQDADNYPTLIRFNAGGEIWEMAGRESLPYLNKLIVAWGETNEPLDSSEAATAAYLFPQVSRRPLMLNYPTAAVSPEIRIRAVGGVAQEYQDDVSGNVTPNPPDSPLAINATANFASGGFSYISPYVTALGGSTLPGLPHDYQFGFTPGQFRLNINGASGIRLRDLIRATGTSGVARLTFGQGLPFNFIMEYFGLDGAWHPYDRLSGITRYAPGGAEILSDGLSGDVISWKVPATGTPAINTSAWSTTACTQAWVKSDERASTGIAPSWCGSEAAPLYFNREVADRRNPYALASIWRTGAVSNPAMLTGSTPPGAAKGGRGAFGPADLSMNLPAYGHYADLDGVIRKADGWRATTAQNGVIPVEPIPAPDPGDPPTTAVPTSGYHYNRPFRSPGEIGSVPRGQPWRTLDFWTEYTADAGLLDIFTTQNQAVVAGVNPNTKLAPVLQATISGIAANLFGFQTDITYGNNPPAYAADIIGHTTSNPFANRAELSETPRLPFGSLQSPSKETTEKLVRALSEVANTRTWNLLIDVVGQAGRYAPSADSLAKFQVQGQTRYWVHLAIDRYTGEIVDKRVEPATE